MKKLSLAAKVFIGFVFGIILGLIFKEKAMMVKPLGDIFLKLIKMIVVPLIFFSITVGIAGMGDIQKLKRIGSKTLLYYFFTTMISGVIALGVANVLKPGSNFQMDAITNSATEFEATAMPSFSETILDMFPENPLLAMTETNLIQIIVFAIFLGVSVVSIGEKGRPILNILEAGSDAMYKMTEIIMEFSPVGVAALMAATIGEYGLKVFGPLGKFIVTDYVGLFLVILILYTIMLKFIAKVSLTKFFKTIPKLWLVTASTTSSSASLPITIEMANNDFKVEEELTSFTLPIGATMNMNGAIVYYASAILFVSQIYGIDLSISQQLLTVVITTLVSVGSPGIPGGGIVMTIMLLNTMGLPMEVVGMIAGIYRILDMGHTTLNCTGDVVSTLCIARGENMIHD